MIRVALPGHLRRIIGIDDELALDVRAPITPQSILDEVETRYPALRGTIREHGTGQRRPYLRYYACEKDISHEPANAPLPDEVASGKEPFLVIGAISGG